MGRIRLFSPKISNYGVMIPPLGTSNGPGQAYVASTPNGP
jgi:hypothetical protein